MNQTENALAREAECFHRVLFGEPAPEAIARRYVALHRAHPLDAEGAMPIELTRLLASECDVEAVEIALRFRDPRNLLTRKLHALCYLAEVRASYFDCFVMRRDARWVSLLALAWHTARSGWKLAKGRFLLWRNGVV